MVALGFLKGGWQRNRKQKSHYTSGRQQRHKVNPTVDKTQGKLLAAQ